LTGVGGLQPSPIGELETDLRIDRRRSDPNPLRPGFRSE